MPRSSTKKNASKFSFAKFTLNTGPSGPPGMYFFRARLPMFTPNLPPKKKTSQARDQHVDNQIMIPTSKRDDFTKKNVKSSGFFDTEDLFTMQKGHHLRLQYV